MPTDAVEWVRVGPREFHAVYRYVHLRVREIMVWGDDDRLHSKGWDGFKNGRYVDRWLGEDDAKRELLHRCEIKGPVVGRRAQ